MYSIVLMMAMTGDINQCPPGAICPATSRNIANVVVNSFRVPVTTYRTLSAPSSSCAGSQATFSSGCSGSRSTLAYVPQTTWQPVTSYRAVPVQSSGCSGSSFNAASVRERMTWPSPVRTWLHNRRANHGGHLFGLTFTENGDILNGTYYAMPSPAPAAAAPVSANEVGGIISNFFERRQIDRQLRAALSNPATTPDAKAALTKALSNPHAWAAVVDRTSEIIKTSPTPAGEVGKLGDGTILQTILNNLPAIMAAVMEILKAFGIG